MNTAAKVRESKERNPKAFCPDSRCLWRVDTIMNPCPKHMARFDAKKTLTEAIHYLRRTHMNTYSWSLPISDEDAIDILSNKLATF